MNIYLLSTLFFILLSSCGITKNINVEIYEELENCRGVENESVNNLHSTHLMKDNVNKLKELDFLTKLGYSKENDTIYVLRMIDIQGEFYITIWNENVSLSYTSESGVLRQSDQLFTKHMIELVSDWNISEIRNEEKNNKVYLPERKAQAIKIIFYQKKYFIDCFYFSDFYNFKRDS